MASNAKREQYLKRERNRKARAKAEAEERALTRIPPPDLPAARLACPQCGHEWVGSPVYFMIEHPPASATITHSVPCPKCGSPSAASNVRMDWVDGAVVVSTAESFKDYETIQTIITALRSLDEDASAEEIADVIERTNPTLKPVADYVRRNHISIVVIVIALLAWLFPNPLSEASPQQPPSEILHSDLEQIISELRQTPDAPPVRTGVDTPERREDH